MKAEVRLADPGAVVSVTCFGCEVRLDMPIPFDVLPAFIRTLLAGMMLGQGDDTVASLEVEGIFLCVECMEVFYVSR